MPDVSKQNTPLILRGTVVNVKRSCGKPNCKCTRGEPHETWALSYSQQGRTRMIALREEDVEIARQGIQRYQQAWDRLETQAMEGIQRLHACVKAAKQKRGPK